MKKKTLFVSPGNCWALPPQRKKKAFYVYEEKSSVSFLFVCLFALCSFKSRSLSFFFLFFSCFNYCLFVNNGCQFYINKTKQERGWGNMGENHGSSCCWSLHRKQRPPFTPKKVVDNK